MSEQTYPESDPTALTQAVAGLPSDFLWGVATSSYQIEGAADEDGRTPSIWDTFCGVPGAIEDGSTGAVACDHYHRMPQDVALISDLGVDSYRFSVAWPRVQPGGRGPVNPRGMDFYDRLVDELLGQGIAPWLTLYHWDLPQELEDVGGWPERDTAYRFADYAELVHDRLGDRVPTWTTLNEPWCSAMLGYAYQRHAPGRSDYGAAIAALHHLMLGHGLAAQRLRARKVAQLGISLGLGPTKAASDNEYDVDAARKVDGMGSRIFFDALVRGRYPADVVEDLAALDVRLPVQDGDLRAISTPLDMVGVNYYFGQMFTGAPQWPGGEPEVRRIRRDVPRTAMDWEIIPSELTELLIRLARDYPGLPLYVTENGAAFDDIVGPSGEVDDQNRTAFIADHLKAVAEAIAMGADVRGYFAWTLIDNFEWYSGYEKRFGLYRVDFETQQRTLKGSGAWFRDTVQAARSRRR